MQPNSSETNPKETLSLIETMKSIGLMEFHQMAQECYESPEQYQKMVLQQILEFGRDTEFGRKHHFSEIKNIDDFRRLVPVSEWTDIELYSDRMAAGEPDLLFPGLAKYFIASTGTTGNKPKLIPESDPGAVARNAVMNLRIVALFLHFPGILQKGVVLPLSNPSRGSKTDGGIPIQFASGTTLNQSMEGTSGIRLAFPTAIFAVTDPATRDYLLMRFAIQHEDVVMILGNNAGRMRELANLADKNAVNILSDIQNGTIAGAGIIEERLRIKIEESILPDPVRASLLRKIFEQTGHLMPRDYWPSLQLMGFWLAASVGHFIKDVRPLMSDSARYMDIGYGASEGKFNIPSEIEQAAGTLSILTAFYEFIPEHGGIPLMAHQLEDQKCYELVITTWSGLYRYKLADVIKVEGFTKKTPNIVFQYKSGDILNIADEKTPASAVNDSIRLMAKKLGIDPVQVQVYADESERRYLCYVEFSP